MPPRIDFPPVRACLFDMDGLLLNTEDLYSESTNRILLKYGRPPVPWNIKAQLQGRPGPVSAEIFHKWAQLPVSTEEFNEQYKALHAELFPTAVALPGVEKLLEELNTASPKGQEGKVHLALATSSHQENFELKTSHLEELFEVFVPVRRVLGDDERIEKGRGKPSPDIYLLALKMVNDSLPEGEKNILPEECLVWEDSVPGVEAGRRAGMRVIWCPHEGLKTEFEGREEDVLAGRIGDGSGTFPDGVGDLGDGWAEYLPSLERFPYEKYGIVLAGTK